MTEQPSIPIPIQFRGFKFKCCNILITISPRISPVSFGSNVSFFVMLSSSFSSLSSMEADVF